ncbi:hypothetical protein OCU04_002177 [Sclerotinia nivalis]|uniref:Uncharacterized protein n=1 Tax=Sclerotinia nivalis TaxID=352851 RepID=A0A9X0DQF3_9HELO|nr:hypothetical protein OCU04_002177 [Sclerotinia nivalis]
MDVIRNYRAREETRYRPHRHHNTGELIVFISKMTYILCPAPSLKIFDYQNAKSRSLKVCSFLLPPRYVLRHLSLGCIWIGHVMGWFFYYSILTAEMTQKAVFDKHAALHSFSFSI